MKKKYSENVLKTQFIAVSAMTKLLMFRKGFVYIILLQDPGMNYFSGEILQNDTTHNKLT